jgi:hypothetical protein
MLDIKRLCSEDIPNAMFYITATFKVELFILQNAIMDLSIVPFFHLKLFHRFKTRDDIDEWRISLLQ